MKVEPDVDIDKLKQERESSFSELNALYELLNGMFVGKYPEAQKAFAELKAMHIAHQSKEVDANSGERI